MSKPKDEVAEMQKQCDAALASLVASWVGTEKELKDFYATNYMGVTGMTLRDYFAGQALCGFISASANRDVLAKLDAGMCYLMADSMTTARNQEAAKNAEADTARLDWLFQDAELNLFFADRAEIDAAMKEAAK